MNEGKRLPVGMDDFKKLRENYCYVDKTRFIKELLDEHSEVTLITRPRRFGKSMAMSMLKYFFSLYAYLSHCGPEGQYCPALWRVDRGTAHCQGKHFQRPE